MQCARCGAGPAGADLFDWCGLCGQKLCDECMAAGCCGMFPAFSGRSQDHSPYEGCCEAVSSRSEAGMRQIWRSAAVLCLVPALGCGSSKGSSPTTPSSGSDLAAAFRTLSARAIYFGHQTVGYNVIDGVAALVAAAPGAAVTIVETAAPSSIVKGTFAHSRNGSNGDPAGKVAAFDATIRGGAGARADIAFFKFCYVDFEPSTDVAGVFAEYRSRMAALEAAFPTVRFVHLTVPLTTGSSADNAARERFSDLIRQTYSSGRVFDLAKVESTRTDGSTELVNGVRALVPAYSSDGGHLNETGSGVVARALVLMLASL